MATCSVREGSEVTLEVRVRMTGTLNGHPVFVLANSPPDGATIDQRTGVFTWTPTEKDGPGRYTFRVRVTLEKVKECKCRERVPNRCHGGEFAVVDPDPSTKKTSLPDRNSTSPLPRKTATNRSTRENSASWRDPHGSASIRLRARSDALHPSQSTVDLRSRFVCVTRETRRWRIKPRSPLLSTAIPGCTCNRSCEESLYLVQLQLSGPGGDVTWPFATCSAIGGRTLLTSAREVLLLAGFRAQGYRVLASQPRNGVEDRDPVARASVGNSPRWPMRRMTGSS